MRHVRAQFSLVLADFPFLPPLSLFFRYGGPARIDRPGSLYVGDAAGRVGSGWKDHGDGDLKFAINAELPFKTPEVSRCCR